MSIAETPDTLAEYLKAEKEGTLLTYDKES